MHAHTVLILYIYMYILYIILYICMYILYIRWYICMYMQYTHTRTHHTQTHETQTPLYQPRLHMYTGQPWLDNERLLYLRTYLRTVGITRPIHPLIPWETYSAAHR